MQDKLILLRKETGTSQLVLAKLLNITEKTYNQKENGKSEFTINEMYAISKYFNMKVSEIFLP